MAEHRLWDGFACSDFLDKQHEYAMFSLLEAMLLRSRPLLFHMHIPHLDYRTDSGYVDRLLGVKGLDVFRLASYQGLARLYKLLNPTQAPLPNLISLDIRGFPTAGEPDITMIEMTAQFGARCLPNLRQLVAPNIRFPADCAPFSALRSITFAGTYGKHHRAHFMQCPHLVRMTITDSTMSTPLPEPPVPPSLEEVSIRSARPRALSLAALMEHWRGVRVRRLVAREAYSLRDVLPLFLESHSRAVEMRLPRGGDDVAFAAMPDDDSLWTLYPSPPWTVGFLASIEKPAPQRLTSISVAFSRLSALLGAQLDTPGLEKLEICIDTAAPLQTAEQCSLRAPHLRSVFFNVDDDCTHQLDDALNGVPRSSFRALIIYEAALLDTIIVSPQVECACAGLSSLAKEYVLVSAQA